MKLQCGWTPSSTETYRWTSQSHPFGSGFNLQTVPLPVRTCFVPPLGYVFVQPDLSQAEARYVAWRAQCLPLIELFQAGRSIHLERAQQIYGRPVQKSEPEYKKAKATVHAANYREGPKRLSLQLSISLKEAKELLKKAMMPYPEIGKWHEEVKELLKKQGYLENCWGQRRYFYTAVGALVATGAIPDAEWKDAIAWEPQSAIPVIIDRAISTVRRTISDISFAAHGHDSFLAAIPEKLLDIIVPGLLRVLDQPMIIRGRELRIPVEMSVGWNWGEMIPYRPGLTGAHWEAEKKVWDQQRMIAQLVA